MRTRMLVSVAVAALAPVAALGPAAGGEAQTCLGHEATIVDTSGDPVDGTAGADVIVATGTVHAGAGDDIVCGTDLWGERGDDALLLDDAGEAHGGPGRDDVTGSAAADAVGGGPGHDEIRLKAGDDVVRGENGNDRILGGRGSDHLKGGDGNDYLHGGPGADSGHGGRGTDELVSMIRTP